MIRTCNNKITDVHHNLRANAIGIRTYCPGEDLEQDSERTLLAPRFDRMGAKGMFIIAPDRVSIASMRATNLGTPNLIAQQRSELMDRAFASVQVP